MVAFPDELLPAFHVLFGAQAPGPTLDGRTLKQVFRRRALETHPDRARATGADAAALTRRFQELSGAYQRLHAFLRVHRLGVVPAAVRPAAHTHPPRRPTTAPRTPPGATARADARSQARPGAGRRAEGSASAGAPQASSSRSAGCGPTPERDDHFWAGPLPTRELLLGQYLYYSGQVSWRALIAAIHWQRSQRPHFGQLAVASGRLAPEFVRAILRAKRFDERTGDAAVRMGYLSPEARDVILAVQRRAQEPLGQFFVATGLLAADELQAAAGRQRMHNWARATAARRVSEPRAAPPPWPPACRAPPR